MNHLITAPILLPAVVAALALLGIRHRLPLARSLSISSSAALLVVALFLFAEASGGAISVYTLGDWRAPFGIVLVLDRLAALMLVLTASLALVVLCYAAATGLDRRGRHFHALFQFQLLGLNGAFLTGDLFNLFVFFEVLLIASYGLMLHGQGTARLKAGVQYVIINLVGSTLFLVAVGILYGIAGTLNMADLAVRVAALPPSDQGLLRAAALLLLAVFGLKAALLPLHLWLPKTYASTSPPVAALFALLTKVGVYSIMRLVTLVFGAQAGAAAWAPAPWMLPAALLTILIGFLGLLAAKGLRELAAFSIIGSTGTLLAAVALFEEKAMAAALYYLPHSTLSGAALFLVCDLLARGRPDYGDAIASGPRFAGMGTIGVLFLLAGIAIVGLPPLSGFVGKLLILATVFPNPAWPWMWGTILGTTLIGIIGFAAAGSRIFWKSSGAEVQAAPARIGREMLAPALLLASLAALTILAGPVTAYMGETAAQLFTPDAYVRAVLGPSGP